MGAVFSGYGGASTLRLQLLVGAVAGTTPTLDVVVEDSIDGVNWNAIATFAQVTAGSARQIRDVTAPFADRVRVRYVVGGGTPSFTFGVISASQSPAVA